MFAILFANSYERALLLLKSINYVYILPFLCLSHLAVIIMYISQRDFSLLSSFFFLFFISYILILFICSSFNLSFGIAAIVTIVTFSFTCKMCISLCMCLPLLTYIHLSLFTIFIFIIQLIMYSNLIFYSVFAVWPIYSNVCWQKLICIISFSLLASSRSQ